VEIICTTGWSKTERSCRRIKRVLKVHNTQKSLARFEDHREFVRTKARKLPKKHHKCLADGNELLSVCKIIRHGFPTEKEPKGGIGVFTTSTSGRALEHIEMNEDDPSMRKALLVCVVIAGRVHRPSDDYQVPIGRSALDSLAGNVGLYARMNALYFFS
ncbi:hypothetical protein MUK42_07667, partial [Musa troglodytarum]